MAWIEFSKNWWTIWKPKHKEEGEKGGMGYVQTKINS